LRRREKKFGGKIEAGLGETAADLKFAMIG